MLLLTNRFMLYEHPIYELEHTYIYDYSNATMYPRADGNGFEWDNVFVDTHVKLKKPIEFIQITSVISPWAQGKTFLELINEVGQYPEEKNQFRNHS